MTMFLMIMLPMVAGALCLALRRSTIAVRALLLLAALLHNCGTALLFRFPALRIAGEGKWMAVNDDLTLAVLGITTLLFLVASIYACFFLSAEKQCGHSNNMPAHIFCALLPCFLSAMTLAVFATDLGLLWVAVEATTIASAPLVCYHRSKGALEAAWKYLIICSAGIALALFGTFLLGVAVQSPEGATLSFDTMTLSKCIANIDPAWFKAAFIFCLAGYGLKMGLAPFHTWLPDAHSEAPAMVSMLLSGALLNCSFLALTRIISLAPPETAPFCDGMMVFFGIFSLAAAAVFIIRQGDYKRMLAYSSVEHMGIIALCFGLGLHDLVPLHMAGHSLCKMTLFLLAGNFLLAYGTRRINSVHGAFSAMPRTSFCWLLGILMICAMPPSPLFYTEYQLVTRAGTGIGITVLILLFAVFCGMTHTAMKMTMGEASGIIPRQEHALCSESLSRIPALTLLTVLIFGAALIFLLVNP